MTIFLFNARNRRSAWHVRTSDANRHFPTEAAYINISHRDCREMGSASSRHNGTLRATLGPCQNAEAFSRSPAVSSSPNIRFMFCTA